MNQTKNEHKDHLFTTIDSYIKQLSLDHSLPPKVDATTWFLGPKAENSEALKTLLSQALESHIDARLSYQPDDPHFNSTEASAQPTNNALQIAQTKTVSDPLKQVLDLLKGSIPMPSYRNQSHMNWDITMPSIVGYFAAMLYNQNNVAPEASPVTTAIEIIVGQDLCRMLGFKETRHEDGSHIIPWGHITCDGSIANAEAIWAARNLSYLPLSLAAAIKLEPDLEAAHTVTVKTCQGQRKPLWILSNWELLNLPIDEILTLIERIENTQGVTEGATEAAIEKYSLHNIGLMAMRERYLDDYSHAKPVICVPKTAHYSWPKSATLIGLGTHCIKSIDVDADGRMDVNALEHVLAHCLKQQRPVLMVVAVIGSTEEGAVDPLAEIVTLRQRFREQGLEFMLHIDGAWGAYFRTMLQNVLPDNDTIDRGTNIDDHPELQLSPYVLEQLEAFPHADSITIDPHKSGFIPYPAGGLCYRNGAMRGLIKFTAPVVFHEAEDKNIGAYGIEGSKPGAAAVSTYLSHAVIPLNRLGYGRLLGRCIFNNKRFYAALISMPCESDLFTITALQRLPIEKSGGTEKQIRDEIDFIRQEIVHRDDNDELFTFFEKAQENEKAKKALALFQAIGSDLSIIAYSFNLKTQQGLNRNVSIMNEFNELIYQKLSLTTVNIDDDKPAKKPDLIVTSSQFDPTHYGQTFTQYFAKRAGLTLQTQQDRNTPLTFIISTTQNPWLTSTSQGNFLDTLMKTLQKTANTAAQEIIEKHNIN